MKYIRIVCNFKKFYDFFRYKIPYGTKNLIRWFPTIWNDRNYDQYFIYVILQKKLQLSEKCLRNGHHMYAEKTADEVKLCSLILDRLIKDEYDLHAFKRHDEKWGEANFNFKEIKDKPGYSSLHITHEKVKTEKDKEEEQKDFKRSYENEQKLKEQDLDLLFKLMRKHIQGWWD